MTSKAYLNPTVTVDIVLLTIRDQALQVLLITRDSEPFKELDALPGGYLLVGETTETAAKRVLKEKAGVENVYIEQLYTFDEAGRDPRGPVFSVTYLALVPPTLIPDEQSGTQHPKWFPIKKLPKLAFDHKKIIHYAKERLKGKIEYTTIGFGVLPKLFTLTQLQQVYEIILEKEIDKRNFRKKIEQLGFLKETKETLSGMRQRPAKLYTLGTKSKTIQLF
jgi:8-oxo-dGTP diphosphatase